MTLDRESLRNACFELTRATVLEKGPADVTPIQNLADRFFQLAGEHEDCIVGQGRDPNLITRAVRYLLSRHAIPPMRNDTEWFTDMLQTIIEIACPNCVASVDDERFLRDIEDGLAVSRSHYQEMKQ